MYVERQHVHMQQLHRCRPGRGSRTGMPQQACRRLRVTQDRLQGRHTRLGHASGLWGCWAGGRLQRDGAGLAQRRELAVLRPKLAQCQPDEIHREESLRLLHAEGRLLRAAAAAAAAAARPAAAEVRVRRKRVQGQRHGQLHDARLRQQVCGSTRAGPAAAVPAVPAAAARQTNVQPGRLAPGDVPGRQGVPAVRQAYLPLPAFLGRTLSHGGNLASCAASYRASATRCPVPGGQQHRRCGRGATPFCIQQ